MPPLHPPRAGAKRGDGERGRIVDIERQLGQPLAGEGELLEILAAELAAPQGFGGHLGLLGKDAGGELVGAHFEAEEGDRRAVIELAPVALPFEVLLGAVEGDIGGQRGLAHAGASGKDDEVGIVQARCLAVDRGEAGGLARQAAARLHCRFDQLDGVERGFAEGRRLAPGARAFGDLEQIGLGLRDAVHRGGVLRSVERAFHQPAPDAHQLAQQGEIVDLLGQLARGEQARAIGGELGEIGRAAQFAQRLVRLEIGAQRDRRGGGITLDQGEHAFIDALVERFEEVFGPDGNLQFLDHPVVDQHRAQKRGLGIEIRGQLARRGLLRGQARADRGHFFGFGHAGLMRLARGARQGRNTPIFIRMAVDSVEI